MYRCKYYILPLLMLLLFACNSKKTGLDYMLSVENDEKLVKQEQLNEFILTSCFRPGEYLAMRELIKHGNQKNDTTGLNKELSNYNDAVYFDVRISLKDRKNIIVYNLGNQSGYATRIDYLNNGIYNDFYIQLDDLSKIKPLGHSFQNKFGAGNDCDISLVFPKKVLQQKGSIELIYKDRVFGLGDKVRFLYPVKHLKKYQL